MMPGRYPEGCAGWLGGLAGRFGQVLAVVEAVTVVSLFSPLLSTSAGFHFTNKPIFPGDKTLDKPIFPGGKPSTRVFVTGFGSGFRFSQAHEPQQRRGPTEAPRIAKVLTVPRSPVACYCARLRRSMN